MYRDDHEAALLRIDDLERENEALRREVSVLRRVRWPSLPVSTPTPVAPPKPTWRVDESQSRETFVFCAGLLLVFVLYLVGQ
jgi:hypothetical protein